MYSQYKTPLKTHIFRAEEDEKIAKQLMEQEQLQNQAHKMAIELTDEVSFLFQFISEEESLSQYGYSVQRLFVEI